MEATGYNDCSSFGFADVYLSSVLDYAGKAGELGCVFSLLGAV